MIEIPIKSSNIKSLFYDEVTLSLFVFFNSGSLYVYKDVSLEESMALRNKGGKYFYENIRDVKSHTKKY